MRTKAVNLALIVFSLVASLFLCEGVLRIFNYFPLLQYDFYLKHDIRDLDEDLILAPKLLSGGDFGAYVKADDKVVVSLGDSFTEGSPGPTKESYPYVLNKLLINGGTQDTVLNAGWGHSGPGQHFRKFNQDIINNIKPGLVIWAFYVNDIWDNVILPVYDIDSNGELIPLNGKTHWLYLRQVYSNNFPIPQKWKDKSYLFNLTLKLFEFFQSTKVPNEFKRNATDWGWKKFNAQLDKMEELSKNFDFKLLYVLIPPESVYLQKEDKLKWSDEHWANQMNKEILKELNNRENFLYLVFKDEDIEKVIVPSEHSGFEYTSYDIFTNGSVEPYMTPGVFHFNKKGYRLMAEMICEKIDRDLDYPCKVN